MKSPKTNSLAMKVFLGAKYFRSAGEGQSSWVILRIMGILCAELELSLSVAVRFGESILTF